jgi:hypothetical protein
MLSNMVDFKLVDDSRYSLVGDADDLEWLQLLPQFSTVQALYISQKFAMRIASALESISGEMVAEALPSLDLICLEDQPISSVEKFFDVRKLSGRPITAVSTEEEFDRIVNSSGYSRK